MPPEEPHSLVAIQLDFNGGELRYSADRVYSSQEFLRVSWYTTPAGAPSDYQAFLGRVVFAYIPSVANTCRISDLRPTKRGDRYTWRDTAQTKGLMFAMVLPPGHSLKDMSPLPVEVKKFRDRIAVFWLLYPPQGISHQSVQIEWQVSPLEKGLDDEVEALNRQIFFASKRDADADYDVALSFAGEDRSYVEEVARELKKAGVTVFYDEFEQDKLWGTNLYDHLSEVYSKRARFTVMFISRWYAKKRWTTFELSSGSGASLRREPGVHFASKI